MDEAFNSWLKTPKDQGGAGLAPGTPLDKTTYNMLMREYVKADSNFTPSIVTVTNPATQAAEQAFISSPNSATLMRDVQPKQSLELGADGNMYVVDPVKGLATVVTNAAGEPFGAKAKSNSMAELLAAMGGDRTQAPSGPNFIDRLFGNVPATNAPTATPTPVPSPTPAMQQAAGPAVPTGTSGGSGTPRPTGTNAVAAVAAPTPRVYSAAAYQAKTGQALAPGSYEDAQGVPFDIVP